jgi:hypothetical protein
MVADVRGSPACRLLLVPGSGGRWGGWSAAHRDRGDCCGQHSLRLFEFARDPVLFLRPRSSGMAPVTTPRASRPRSCSSWGWPATIPPDGTHRNQFAETGEWSPAWARPMDAGSLPAGLPATSRASNSRACGPWAHKGRTPSASLRRSTSAKESTGKHARARDLDTPPRRGRGNARAATPSRTAP